MENIALITLLLVLGAFTFSRVWYYFITPTEELYSYYRNYLDVSPTHFKKYLAKKRAAWVAACAVFFSLAGYMIFK